MSEPAVRPGDILAGKYRVDRILGQGNMGVVLLATHVELGQRVALKFMLAGSAAQKDQRERFLREARASVRLKSQHVARVLDVGTLENGSPYIVMEFLEGRDLAAVLAEQQRLPIPMAVEYVLQACEALGEAHAAGIVHRDLKPANLFLTHDVGGSPCVKVLDFGISKFSGADLTLTQDAQALGSPLYMSPEQMNSSRDADGRSDIWSLGILLFQLVAGKTPFHADTIQQLCARVLFGGPSTLAELGVHAPPGFEAALLRCIERDRERRFRDVAELASALAPYAPPGGRAYAERVARAMGATQPVASTRSPESTALMPASSLTGSDRGALTGGAVMAITAQPAGTMLMSSPGSTHPAVSSGTPGPALIQSGLLPPPSSQMTPGAVGDTGLSLASSQGAFQPAAQAQPATSSKAPLIIMGGAFLVAASLAGFLGLRALSTPAGAATQAGSVAQVGSVAQAITTEKAVVAAPAPSASAEPAPSASAIVPAPPLAASVAAPSVATGAAASAKPLLGPKARAPGAPTAAPAVKPKGGVSYDERD